MSMPLLLGVVALLVAAGALINRRWVLLIPPVAALVLALAPEASPSAEDQSSVAALVFAAMAVLADICLAIGMGLRRVVLR